MSDTPHPSGNDRYAIYAVCIEQGDVAISTSTLRLAETSLLGIGLTLVTLDDEGEITDDTRVGILDRETRHWIVNPWAKGAR